MNYKIQYKRLEIFATLRSYTFARLIPVTFKLGNFTNFKFLQTFVYMLWFNFILGLNFVFFCFVKPVQIYAPRGLVLGKLPSNTK